LALIFLCYRSAQQRLNSSPLPELCNYIMLWNGKTKTLV